MKVALGLSGGVDSSVSLALLLEAGHEVTGVFLECWRAPGCRAEEDRKDALQVALDAGIPFRVLDFKDAYRQRVVDIFFRDYSRGLTPNPDVWCNTEIKFGLFYDWALAQGFDAVATGHYAQVGTRVGAPALLRGADAHKDQSYFLYRTRQEQLEHILFPIGHLQKSEVRALAKEKGIFVADKPDSQGICFIGDIDVTDFLEEHLGEKPGDVLDTDGNVIGTHRGVWFYTIGQRHGFTLLPKVRVTKEEWKHVLPPLYVIAKDADTNTITVGYGVETTRAQVGVRDVILRSPASESLQALSPGESAPTWARVRHGGKLLAAHVSWKDDSHTTMILTLDEPQRGLAPGQAVVFYDWEDSLVCLGGGEMTL